MKDQERVEKKIDESLLDLCLAGTVAEGDIVNLRFLFMPSSPFRKDSTEEITMSKYAYLLPDREGRGMAEALALVGRSDIAAYVRTQLEKKGPPQLPWELVQALGDNAVRWGKYTAASQAYELLRIRRRMQDMFLDQADEALHQDRTDEATAGYAIASGLQYDYAAFPEALPAVPNYQERALTLHATYPAGRDQALPFQADGILSKSALNFLLLGAEFNQRFDGHEESRLVYLAAGLIRHTDSDWEAFVQAFKEAGRIAERYEPLFERINGYTLEAMEVLFDELFNDEQKEELRQIALMLAPDAPSGREWWQSLRALAYRHPGGVLFVARQRLSATEEILVPCCRPDSQLAALLGLCP